jgi:ribosomal protein L28
MKHLSLTATSAMLLALTPVMTQAEEAVLVEAEIVRVEVDAEVIRVIDKNAPVVKVEKQAEGKDKATEGEKAENGKAVEEKSEEASDDKKVSEEDLRKKMRELERELQDARNKFQEKANEERQQAQQKALKALDDIKLPENPTREQCEAFVAELRKACEGRRSFSSSDPATKKLKEIPPENFDLLVTEMANRTSLRYYANYALREIDPEKLRERFVNSIDDNPNNIGIIVMHGWVEDIRPAIIEHINGADGSITPAWFQAGVELGEPSLYPKLHEITTQSRYASQFVTMLEMLPDYDLAHTVDVCWRRAKDGKLSVSYSTFAPKAAEYGNVDALGSLVDTLRTTSSYLSHSSTYNMRRTNVLKYIDFRGSNQDIQEWYKANKDKLVFDDLRKRFVVPEDF